jgi:hypothetical protein
MDGKDATKTRAGTCRECGVAVVGGKAGRVPSLCGECRQEKNRERARNARYEIECRGCQKTFVSIGSSSRKLCDDCLGNHRKPEMMACVICGNQQKRWKAGGKNAGLCCSRKCSGILTSRRAKERRLADPNRLKPLVEFCRRLIEKERNEQSRAYLRSCLAIAGWMHEWDEPLRARRQRKRHKPKGNQKHAARAKKKGLPRSFGKSMSIDAVGRRDHWTCQLCMCPIEDPGSRKSPFSPCVDHIVPINHPDNARHGHTEDNVQIAHRRCNEAKGCSVACESLLTCDNPREWLAIAGITQTPGVARNAKNQEKAKTPRALDADF